MLYSRNSTELVIESSAAILFVSSLVLFTLSKKHNNTVVSLPEE